MIARPSTVDELAEVIAASPRVRLRGRGTKRPLSGGVDDDATVTCELSALRGVLEYTPEECTFTALAGTPLSELTGLLESHGQWLPCDPPLVDAGATIGGTVASGLNGSCRYRFGGIRDFIIGARIVDGRGRVSTSGGKVVKNAAGFLLHQAMVGSCGRLGALAELTFKVFPRPDAFATVSVATADLHTALTLVARLHRARFDLDALDMVPNESGAATWSVLVRIGGFREALDARLETLRQAIGDATTIHLDSDDDDIWRGTREFAWVPRGTTLVRVPTTLPLVPRVEEMLTAAATRRRYAVAGNLTLVAWPGPLDALASGLRDLGLAGQLILGDAPADAPFIGALAANPFADRLRGVLDPDGKF